MADKIASYVAQKGLPMYSYFINGQQFEGMSSSLQQDLMQHVFGEQQKLGQLVQVGVIKFKSNVYGYMTGTVKKKKAKKHTQQFAYSKYDARVFDRVEYLPLVTPPGSPGSQGSTTVSRDVLLNPDLAIRLPYLKPQEDAAPVKEKKEGKEGKEGKDGESESGWYPLNGHDTLSMQGVHLVKVPTIAPVLNVNYFLEQIDKCEANYLASTATKAIKIEEGRAKV